MVPSVLGSPILERSSSQVSSRVVGKGRFLPFARRSERRGAGPGLDDRSSHSSGRGCSTALTIRSLSKLCRLPEGFPRLSFRAPWRGALRTDFGKIRKRSSDSQDDSSRSFETTFASPSAHCVRQPRGTCRRSGMRNCRTASGAGRYSGLGSVSGVGGRWDGPSTGEIEWAGGGKGAPREA